VLDNFAAGTMEGLGIGYEALKAVNPGLIVVSMPMMGLHGPESRYQGYGSATEVLGGLTYLTGYEGGGPELSSFLFGDPVAGINAASAILLALLHRAETGEGQFIDLSQVEVVASYTGDAIMHYVLRGENPTRRGNAHDVFAPHGVYRCDGEDRWVAIAVTTDEEWDALCRAIGDGELLADESLWSGLGRIEQRTRIDSRIEAWTSGRDPIEVTGLLQTAGVPAGNVATSRDLYEDPHLAARGYFEPVEQPFAGTHLYPGAGWKMSLTSQRSRLPSPRLGEHNDYVLRSLLGLSTEELQSLTDTKVIGEQPLVDVWAG
jgi:crotonobetainyl-CoA:carnitine CoA-transferase CaiB-like acyl-CoA transferase